MRSFSLKMRDSSFSWKPKSLDESESGLEDEGLSQRHGGTEKKEKIKNVKRKKQNEEQRLWDFDFRKLPGQRSIARSATD